MFKINITHILLFLIIICLLYTLLNDCGCIKDGFSVGGVISASDIHNNDGYLILNQREIVNQVGFSEYYMNNATRIYTTFVGRTKNIPDFGEINWSHFYYVYYNTVDHEFNLIEFGRQTRSNGNIETTLELKPIPFDILNEWFSIDPPGDPPNTAGSLYDIISPPPSTPPSSTPPSSTPSTTDSNIAILNPIVHDLEYIPPTYIYIRDVPTMDRSVYSEINVNDPPFGPDIQDNPNEIVQHVNVNAPRIRSLLQIFKIPISERPHVSDLSASLVYRESIISNDNIDYGYYIGKSHVSSPTGITPISLFCMNQNYLWNDFSNDGSLQYRIDNLTLTDINKYFCNKPHHLSEMYLLEDLPIIDTITNDISNHIETIQNSYPRIYLRQDIINEVQFYISKSISSSSSSKIVIIQINPESSEIRFFKIVVNTLLQVNRYFLYTQIYNTPTCDNIYSNSIIKNYALRTEERNVPFECDSFKTDYQDILCINRGCSAHECCNEQSTTAGPLTNQDKRFNQLCDIDFDLTEGQMGGHTYYSMGHQNLGSEGQFDCCNTINDISRYRPDTIEELSQSLQNNVHSYLDGCIDGENIDSDSSPTSPPPVPDLKPELLSIDQICYNKMVSIVDYCGGNPQELEQLEQGSECCNAINAKFSTWNQNCRERHEFIDRFNETISSIRGAHEICNR